MGRSSPIGALIALGALLLGAATATAQKSYPLSGRIVSNRGTSVQIPLLGNTLGNCTGPVKGHRTGYLGVSARPYFQSVTLMMQAAPYGCAAISGSISSNADIRALGATFSVPPGAISRPFRDSVLAVSVPSSPAIVQLATQFRISGPPTARPTSGPDAPGYVRSDFMGVPMTRTLGPTKLMTVSGIPTNLAPLRRFQRSAWAGQTGRAGSTFTWCYDYGPCTNIVAGQNMIVKVSPGLNRFGGTMSYLVQVGFLPSSLAVANIASGPVELLRVIGGQQPTGRGYADLLTDRVMTGQGYDAHRVGVVTPPAFGGAQLSLITMLTGALVPAPGTQTAFTNANFGFPWTTGTALVKQTGTTLGMPMSATFTAMGSDSTSTTAGGGMARNLTLVAPQLAHTNLNAGTNTAGLGFLTLTLPEPNGSAQLLAGALALVTMAAWRSRGRSA